VNASSIPSALYERQGDLYVPTELTRGPWHPSAQHGGPPAALLSQKCACFENGDAMFVARITIELLRPVPLTPLSVRVRLARPGRKVQLVEACLMAEAVEVARAVAVRIRRNPVELPRLEAPDVIPPPPTSGAASLPPWAGTGDTLAYHSHGVDHRFVHGGFDKLGPATDWIRLRTPVVGGEDTHPLARVAAAADFGNGISAVLARVDGYTFINPDLTLYLHRHPAGEWVCLDATTRVEAHGCGLAESRLYDETDRIGRSLQSLLVERI